MTKAEKAASINAAIAEVEAMQARQWRALEEYRAEFASIQRDVLPPPYGDEERELRYEKLRLLHQAFLIGSTIISAYVELIKMEQEEYALMRE